MGVVRIAAVIPAYDEGDRLAGLLHAWADQALSRSSVVATAFVVDDGSRAEDETRQRRAAAEAAAMLDSAGAPHRVEYVRVAKNRGKGASIRWGWSHADADTAWFAFIDADGAVPAREFWRLADRLAEIEADVVCGSRIRMAGRSVERSLFRHLQGRTFATIVEVLFHLGFYDTQCGLKFVRASHVRAHLPRLQENRWLLDIELLSLLRADGARCVEVPIDCHQRGASSLVFGLDAFRMIVHLVRLRSRLAAGAPGSQR